MNIVESHTNIGILGIKIIKIEILKKNKILGKVKRWNWKHCLEGTTSWEFCKKIIQPSAAINSKYLSIKHMDNFAGGSSQNNNLKVNTIIVL